MRYLSTRDPNGVADQTFCDILLAGLAPDGGLYLPERYPHIDKNTRAHWRTLLTTQGYAALAHAVTSLFIDDIPSDDLRGICERAYSSEKFTDPRIVPVSQLAEGIHLLHLSNGPTAAFKDMAMQLLGELFEYELNRRQTHITILGATSGDTGSSAEYAMLGKDRVRVFMLSPAGRMTPFQQAQMFSINDPAIVNIAVAGVFDDCQDIVKAVNADTNFKRTHNIGAVNSINWARLLAQVVYYIAGWLYATTDNDEPVSFVVPTGNFGNIVAGHIAKQMGIPITSLVCATNENDVLAEFFTTGTYRIRGAAETHATSSPSMDISKASNFERFVFDLLDRDGARTAQLFGPTLATEKEFTLANEKNWPHVAQRYGFRTGTSSHTDRLATIASVHANDGILIDPHTADGIKVARDRLAEESITLPVLVAETALPVKFAETITEAIGEPPPLPERFAHLRNSERHVIQAPNDAHAVKKIITEHTQH
ncbi:threonine synthase [Dermatophilus congolensis]|uniref:threonine synthase n=1 Tax=Dermatophilus congolensis TaxID=1863 RepID=UPI001AAE69C2|nr:threonine synthase [Dermatophilus congolensis]MBO3152053.1 threonine synthase [Dermatophilus congolensis]MBO3160935.1 threonine synthase [Dermatophilus congolensis]MBO3163339.1 threonine synthase [Dermatophilus congolensis]MBO3176892.1 threonine synthase [Dermatophilus congolensis]